MAANREAQSVANWEERLVGRRARQEEEEEEGWAAQGQAAMLDFLEGEEAAAVVVVVAAAAAEDRREEEAVNTVDTVAAQDTWGAQDTLEGTSAGRVDIWAAACGIPCPCSPRRDIRPGPRSHHRSSCRLQPRSLYPWLVMSLKVKIRLDIPSSQYSAGQ